MAVFIFAGGYVLRCHCVHPDSVRQLGRLIKAGAGAEISFLQLSFTVSSSAHTPGLLHVLPPKKKVVYCSYEGKQTYIVCFNGKGDQSRIIKEMCELQEVTDVLPCLIHVELLHAVSGLRTSVICHLATNLLPGYNKLFLISIGSKRTRVERLVSLDRVFHVVSIQRWCHHMSLQQTCFCAK